MAHYLLYARRALPAARAERRRRKLTRKEMLRTVLRTALVAVTLAALYLLYLLRGLVLTVFVAIIVATALRPLVEQLHRRLRLSPPAAGLALYGLMAVALLGGAATIVPSVVAEAAALLARAPEIYGAWYEMATELQASARATLHVALPVLPTEAEVGAWVIGTAGRLEHALPQLALRTGGVLAHILLGLVLAYYWPEARDGLVAYGLRAVVPARRERFLSLCEDIEGALGGFVAGQVMLSSLIGLATLLAFVAIGLPNPLLLAAIGGLLHLIPILGATIGALPALVVAVSLSPVKGLATGLALLLIHQVENSLIAPRVLHRQVGISPLLVLVALMMGAALGGAVGALIAVPAAGASWVLLRYLIGEAEGEDRVLADKRLATPGPAPPQAVDE